MGLLVSHKKGIDSMGNKKNSTCQVLLVQFTAKCVELSLMIHGWQQYPKSTCWSLYLEGFICTSSQTSMELGSKTSSVQYSSLFKERGIQRKQERSLKGKERKNYKDKRMSQ